MSELDKIIASVRDVYDGNPWYGSSVMAVLSKIPVDNVNKKIQNSHSVIELVLHMTSWRKFVIHKLQGDESHEVSAESNFPAGSDWAAALANLQESQNNLLMAMASFDNKNLENQVPNRKYSFSKLLNGIVQHDIYHLGQIAMITKQFQP